MVEMSTYIIGDDTYEAGRSAEANGYVARDYQRTPYGAVGSAPPANIQMIDMEEFPDRIADLERNNATLKDRWLDSPIGILDQNGFPFCHGFAAVEAVMLARHLEGLPYIKLSPSSVAAPVTGYKKAGAWIGADLKQIVNVGAAPASLIPMLTYQRSDFPPGWEQEAAKCKVSEFSELRSRDFQQQGSALLQGFGVSVGQSHWSHAVLQCVLRDVNKHLKATDHNRYGIEFANSWGIAWGVAGWAVQTGSKKFADEAYVLRQVIV